MKSLDDTGKNASERGSVLYFVHFCCQVLAWFIKGSVLGIDNSWLLRHSAGHGSQIAR